MINIRITDYGTLKSDNPNFKEKTVEDFLREIEKLLFEDEFKDINFKQKEMTIKDFLKETKKIFFEDKYKSKYISFKFEQRENECEICLDLNKYKIRLDSKDSKNFKILSHYNKLTNRLEKYTFLLSKKDNFALLFLFGSVVSTGMLLALFINIGMSGFFGILLLLVFIITTGAISQHIFNNFIKSSILKINNEFEEKRLDLIKKKTLEDILEKDKKITVEEQKLLSDSIVLNEVAKLSIKIDSLNHQDKVIFAKRLKQLLNEYREKVNSLNPSSESINLQINDIVYIEREVLGILSVMDLECEKLILNDTKKKQHDKTIGILDNQLEEMIEESSNEIYSGEGVQYIKKIN